MLHKYIIALAVALLLPMAAEAATSIPAILPHPAQYTVNDGSLTLPGVITVDGDMATEALRYLDMHGIVAEKTRKKPLLVASVDNNLASESYILTVDPKGIDIKAADKPGLMYAVETMTQLIEQTPDRRLPACVINDTPRMRYRGFMIDVVRCYLPIDELKKFIDVAASIKLNKLHLHLTDDNGWRMEIKKYPKLTEVGAYRVDRPEQFGGRSNPRANETATYGGFYTQDELRELVRYAADRNIDIIPEIEMPAHALGAIASYPELCCPVYNDYIGVLPGIGGDMAAVIMCAGKDSTLDFVKDVLDEVMEVFPSDIIHLGGDEANKRIWEKCPLCNQRLQAEHLHDFEQLQGWFMDRIISYVNSKGRRAIGWDEVTIGKPKQDIVIMGWRGNGEAAEKYARETGRDFIMTPARSTYLIRYQGPQWFEPFTYFGNITLQDAYDFEPVKPTYTPAMREQLLGIQGSMWNEFCRTPQEMQYMVFPRLMALADVAWRPEGTRDWDGFIKALDAFLPRLGAKDMVYATSMYNVQHTAMPNGDGTVTVQAQCIRPDARILVADTRGADCYAEYTQPIVVTGDADLYIRALTPALKGGQVLNLVMDFNKATGCSVACDTCTNGLGKVMLNGIRGSLRNSDFEWAGWYDRNAAFTVDLGQSQPIGTVKLGALANANMNVALPARVDLYLAGDDGIFTHAVHIATDEQFSLSPQVVDLDFGNIDATARYVRITADNPGHIPAGYPRENNATWLYFDEIIID